MKVDSLFFNSSTLAQKWQSFLLCDEDEHFFTIADILLYLNIYHSVAEDIYL